MAEDPHKKQIQDNRAFLVENLDLTGTVVLDLLVQMGVLSQHQLVSVKDTCGPNNLEVSRTILDHFYIRPYTDWQKFLTCLQVTGQSHIVEHLQSPHRVVHKEVTKPLPEPMEIEAWQKILLEKRVYLIAKIDLVATGLWNYLLQEDVCTAMEKESIVARKPANDEQVSALLDLLQTKTEGEFDKFLLALIRSGQAPIADTIVPTANTTYLPIGEDSFRNLSLRLKGPGDGAQAFTNPENLPELPDFSLLCPDLESEVLINRDHSDRSSTFKDRKSLAEDTCPLCNHRYDIGKFRRMTHDSCWHAYCRSCVKMSDFCILCTGTSRNIREHTGYPLQRWSELEYLGDIEDIHGQAVNRDKMQGEGFIAEGKSEGKDVKAKETEEVETASETKDTHESEEDDISKSLNLKSRYGYKPNRVVGKSHFRIPDVTATFFYKAVSTILPSQIKKPGPIKYLILSSGVQRSHKYFYNFITENPLDAEFGDWTDGTGHGTDMASALCQFFKHSPKSVELHSRAVIDTSGNVDLEAVQSTCNNLLSIDNGFQIICVPVDIHQDTCTVVLKDILDKLSQKAVVLCPARPTNKKRDSTGPIRIGSHTFAGNNTEDGTEADYTTPSGEMFVANASFGKDDGRPFHTGRKQEISLGIAAAVAGLATLCNLTADTCSNRSKEMRLILNQLLYNDGDLNAFKDCPLLYGPLRKIEECGTMAHLRFLQPKKLFDIKQSRSVYGKTCGKRDEQKPGSSIPEEDKTATMPEDNKEEEKWNVGHLENLDPSEKIKRCVKTIAENVTGNDIIINVAFLDSGCDITHPHFKDMNVEHISMVETPAYKDRNGHGTAVIGTFWTYFLNTDLRQKIKIINIKISEDDEIELRAMAEALKNLNKRGETIHIINISCGLEGYPSKSSLPGRLVSQLCEKSVVICAASNEGPEGENNIFFPASDAIAIGSCDGTGDASDFSPSGRLLLFLGPGEDIGVPCPRNDEAEGGITEDYICECGTSFASPYVTAVATLLLIKASHEDFETDERETKFLRSTRVMKRLLRLACSNEHPTEHTTRKGYGYVVATRLLGEYTYFVEALASALQRSPNKFGKDI